MMADITTVPDFRSARGLFAQLETEHGLPKGSGKEILSASAYNHERTTAANGKR
jgi:NAD-dependent SIR2 family protein deacetylase